MLLEEKYTKLKKLQKIMEEEETLIRELDMLNVFQNNKFNGQQIAVRDALERAELDYKYSNNSNGSNCGMLLKILDALKIPKQKAYHLGVGDYVEIEDNVIYYVSYPFSVYGGQGSQPKKKEEITVDEAIRLIVKHKNI